MQEAVLFQRVVSLVRSLAIELVANIRQNRADTSSYIECMLQKIMNWMLAKRGFRPPVKGECFLTDSHYFVESEPAYPCSRKMPRQTLTCNQTLTETHLETEG